MHRKNARRLMIAGLLFFVVGVGSVLFRAPSHDRVWEMGHEKVPHIVFEEDQMTIEHLRDFTWTGSFEADARYIEESYDLRDMERVDVVISHFDDFEGLAHIFLSFGFVDGRQVSVSLETRREADEEYSPWLGLLREYEIIYVVGTDKDLLGIRTGHRNERVYIYPTVATPEQAQQLFVRIAENVNEIYAEPRFYNTLTHNCTNELTREVEAISTVEFPFSYKAFLPGYFDEVLYDMGLIDTTRSFEEVKRAHLVANELVDESDENYAVLVREVVGK